MPELFYLHGSGHTHESFQAQAEAFAGSDAVSLPGHPQGEAFESVSECAAWFERYLHWRKAGKAVVAGNSLGGAIAMEWALDYPSQVAGLILIGTGARLRVSPQIFSMLDERWPDCIETLADFALAPSAPLELRARTKAWHLQVGRESTRRDYAACNDFDIMDRVAEISAPALIVVGVEDRLTPPKYARFLHERIAGSELLVVEGAGHMVMAEKPAEVNAAIGAFLARL